MIPLLLGDNCPFCFRPLASLAEGRCDACLKELGPAFESLGSVHTRLREMSGGWTLDGLKLWLRPRPQALALTQARGSWPSLAGWVEESCWEGWRGLDQSRAERGWTLRSRGLRVQSMLLEGLGEFEAWAAVRIQGQRSLLLQEGGRLRRGSPLQLPFDETWCLRFKGEVPIDQALYRHCPDCGAASAPWDEQCGHCGDWLPIERSPWQLYRILDHIAPEGVDGLNARNAIKTFPSWLDRLEL